MACNSRALCFVSPGLPWLRRDAAATTCRSIGARPVWSRTGASISRLALRFSLSPRSQLTSPPFRIAGIVAAAVVLSSQGLCASPLQAASIEPPQAMVGAAEVSAEALTDTQLLEMSRRNSRVTGEPSQVFGYARRLAASGDLPGALAQYNALIDAAPTFAGGWSNRANVLIAQGKLSDAIPDYSKALELAPVASDAWVILVNRGSTHLALGDTQRALDDFNLALTKSGVDKASVYSNRAGCYEALAKWDVALRDYQRAIEANASDVKPWWLRYGMVLYERGRISESIGIMRRVATRYDADDVHAALAGVLFSKGDIPEAEGQWSMVTRPRQFSNRQFLEDRKWTPKMVEAMEEYSAGKKTAPLRETQS